MATKKTNTSTKEPTSMEELLAMHKNFKTFKKMDVVQAQLKSVEEKMAIFEVGGKSEAVVREDSFIEAKNFIKKLSPGDSVEALVLDPESSDGMVVLSLRHAAKEDFWKRIQKYHKDDKIIEVTGQSASNYGLMVSIENETAFIPSSQFTKEKAKNLDELVGKRVSVKIIDLDQESGRIVLSERAVSEAEDIAKMKRALASFKKGEKYKGIVTTIVSFGAFVEIEADFDGEKMPVEGLVHVSEMSWSKIDSPHEVVEEGQTVDVIVLGVEKNKLALSMREAKEDPWTTIADKYKADDKLRGTIVRISDFGAFVELEPGVEGLVHMTKIAPGTALKEGEELNVYIEDIDTKNKKISLGIVVTASKPIGYR